MNRGNLNSRLREKLRQLGPRKPERSVPVGWWQDSRGVSQPPGSYLDPSLRRKKSDGRD